MGQDKTNHHPAFLGTWYEALKSVFATTDREASGSVELFPSALGVFLGMIRGSGSIAPRSSPTSLETLTVV